MKKLKHSKLARKVTSDNKGQQNYMLYLRSGLKKVLKTKQRSFNEAILGGSQPKKNIVL